MNEHSQVPPISAAQARRRCEPRDLGFDTTDQVADLPDILGQQRAKSALEFGARVRGPGFNLYVLGRPGSLRHELVGQFLAAESGNRPCPPDLCYVNNFQDARKPRQVSLPPGLGKQFRDDMKRLVEDLQASIPAAFESENYRNQLNEIQEEFQQRHKEALQEIGEEAERENLALMPTPSGFAIAPLKGGKVISEEAFKKLPEKERLQTEEAISRLSEKLRRHLESLPSLHKMQREKTHELDRNIIMLSVGGLIQELKKRYAELPRIIQHLDAVEADVIEHAQHFRSPEQAGIPMVPAGLDGASPLGRYAVNLLVDNADTQGAPVVYESLPSHQNLVGNLEHRVEFGNLVTDFKMIRAGALHRANGGYLIVDAERLLTQPLAWESMKRALYAGEIVIESAGQLLSLVSTQGLEPEPVKLQVKVVVLGSRLLYYLLSQYDPDFAELFKVAADFEDDMDWTEENTRLYGRMLATLVRRRELLPFSAAAASRVIEQSARYADDSEKLSTRLRSIADLLTEASHCCRDRQASRVEAEDVDRAELESRGRHDRLYRRVLEAIRRGTILIDTDGYRIGQVNGLSVVQLGEASFGQPARISATVRVGEGDVLDIERESELGGAIHSKGVLILSSYLGGRYAREWPLSLTASLVFEQSYAGVEGDSASVAELCALLSAIGEIPVRQDLAITGSMNQHGEIQAIGGVNEKIEGFFDVCQSRGLTGRQGVLIPASNLKYLMLRQDVVNAIQEGVFSVYPVRHVDQAAALLSGLQAGEPDQSGVYPDDSLHGRIAGSLQRFSECRLDFIRQKKEAENSNAGEAA